ncbi:MAG: sugar ABC transporter permease [Candidatus Atribacteria bacterium]|nr:sugar ABC transporter permease [Candidatus Atribacteria bacterium]
MKKQYAAVWFVLPATIIILLLVIYPMVYSLFVSFHSYNIAISQKMTFIGIENFKNIFLDGRFWNSIINTVILVVVGCALQLTLGLAIALLLNQKLRSEAAIKVLILLPMLMAPVVVAQMWKIMLQPNIGCVNYFLQLLHVTGQEIEWLTKSRLAIFSLLLVDLWQWTPFVTIVTLAGLYSMPTSPLEAARVDGASGFQIFRYVSLPLLKPILIVVVLIRSIDIYRLLEAVVVMTEGGPGFSTETVSFYVFSVGFKYFNIGYAAALSYFISIILSLVVGFFINSLNREMRGAL